MLFMFWNIYHQFDFIKITLKSYNRMLFPNLPLWISDAHIAQGFIKILEKISELWLYTHKKS